MRLLCQCFAMKRSFWQLFIWFILYFVLQFERAKLVLIFQLSKNTGNYFLCRPSPKTFPSRFLCLVHVPFYKSKDVAKGKISLCKQDILPVGRYNRPDRLKKTYESKSYSLPWNKKNKNNWEKVLYIRN